MISVIIPLIHTSIYGQFSSVSTSIVSACNSGVNSRRYSYLSINPLCDEQSSSMYQYVQMRSLFHISISVFIIFKYYSVSITVSNSRRR